MDKKSSFSGKRFLIAQPMIRSFCGSTMVTLELAEYLISVGASVVVYTNIAFPPALTSFEKAGIKVVSSREKFSYSLKDFDYVWVHSLTMPQQLLEELKHPLKKMPAFIFLHMSPLESIPDEHPWIYNLENSLSSLSLYISEGTLESNKKFGLPSTIGFFRNPASAEFQDIAKRKASPVIKKALMVSNHLPEEVLEAKRILSKQGIIVETYGDRQDKYTSLSPNILKKYDAVITIGKTVQYCIVGSLPVYIYDWFGGPGWLTAENYEHSRFNNFSGRFSEHKTGRQIAQEIVDGYAGALDFHMNFLAENNKEYIIDYVLEDLLKRIKPKKVERFDNEYIESAKVAVHCAEIRFTASEELGNAYKCIDDLNRQLEDCRGQVRELDEYRKKYYDLAGSKRMKVLDGILKPHDKIKEYLRNKSKDDDIKQ